MSNRTARLFICTERMYAKHHADGEALRVGPAEFNTGDPETPKTEGVAIFTGQKMKLLLTAEHAYILANLIADTLEKENAA